MVEPSRLGDEWERKQALAVAMLDFLEGWVVRELCLHLRTISEAVFCETPENRLVKTLVASPGPLTLAELAVRCEVSKDSLYPDGRIRRVLDRMKRRGLVVDTGSEGKPRFALDRSHLEVQLLAKIFEDRGRVDGLVAVTLRDSIGPFLE